jgi:hypothetical protein
MIREMGLQKMNKLLSTRDQLFEVVEEAHQVKYLLYNIIKIYQMLTNK